MGELESQKPVRLRIVYPHFTDEEMWLRLNDFPAVTKPWVSAEPEVEPRSVWLESQGSPQDTQAWMKLQRNSWNVLSISHVPGTTEELYLPNIEMWAWQPFVVGT